MSLPTPANLSAKEHREVIAARYNQHERNHESVIPHALVAGGKVLRKRDMSHREARILNENALSDFRESIGPGGKAEILLERWVIDREARCERMPREEMPFGVPDKWPGTREEYVASLAQRE